jgi:hypothetical protein
MMRLKKPWLILFIMIVIASVIVGGIFLSRSKKEPYLTMSALAYGQVDNELQNMYYDQLYGFDEERWIRTGAYEPPFYKTDIAKLDVCRP